MGLGPSGGGGGDGEASSLPLDSPAAQQHDPLVWVLLCELRRLTVALAPVVRDVLVGDYEELWTGVVIRCAWVKDNAGAGCHGDGTVHRTCGRGCLLSVFCLPCYVLLLARWRGSQRLPR